jgi:hypothetical protein
LRTNHASELDRGVDGLKGSHRDIYV